MARRLYAYAFTEDFVLLYPVYSVLFADTGLSDAQISSLFLIWSLTSIASEVPSGAWADVFSRRRLLILAPLLTGAGYALWTFAPCYLSFAAGFLLWGVGSSLRSGTMQALVYEELARQGAADRYAELIGRSEAVSTTAIMAAGAVAAPVLAAGGYRAVGIASVAATLLCALVARTMPEPRRSRTQSGAHERAGDAGDLAGGAGERPGGAGEPAGGAREQAGSTGEQPGDAVDLAGGAHEQADAAREQAGGVGDGDVGEPGYVEVLRAGLAEVRRARPVRRAVVLLALLLGGYGALDEYVPLLASGTGVASGVVPLLVLVVTVGDMAGGWAAGRGNRRLLGPALAAAAVCLAAGALSGTPFGMAGVAAGFAVFRWATTRADAELQARVEDRARATVTSLAGIGSEAVGLLVYGGYALGSPVIGPGALFALVAVPYVVLAAILWRMR
jgi:predicted MFS family arabinose efflux permease